MKTAVAAFTISLLLAPLTAAQVTEKQAVKQVRVAAKVQLKAFKTAGAAALATLDESLATAEGTLADDTAAAPLVATVAAAAATFAQEIAEEQSHAQDQVVFAVTTALDGLANGASLHGLYPESLCAGQLGVVEAFRDQLTKATGTLRSAALARLAKTVKRAEQISGIALRATLRLAQLPSDIVFNEGADTGFFGLGPFLDVAVSGSRLDASDDGVLVVAGHADLAETDVHVVISGFDLYEQDVTPSLQSTRFIATFDNGGLGLAEANYAASAAQGGGQFGSTLALGIR